MVNIDLLGPAAAIDELLVKTSLGLKLLAGANVIKDEKMHTKKMSRILTNLVYKQQKYNLLREETEGYSKLAVILCSIPSYPEDVSQHVRQVLSLIGHFELDPNRALDVILDAFEEQIWNLSFIKLIQQFSKQNIPHILGFKFTYYHTMKPLVEADKVDSLSILDSKEKEKNGGKDLGSKENGVKGQIIPPNTSKSTTTPAVPIEQPPTSTPASLYALAAVLLVSDIITLTDLLPYLKPTLEETVVTGEMKESQLKQDILSHGIVSLTSTAPKSNTGGVNAMGGRLAPPLPPPIPYGGTNHPPLPFGIAPTLGGLFPPVPPSQGAPAYGSRVPPKGPQPPLGSAVRYVILLHSNYITIIYMAT
jgi:hypothetical protein